MTEQLTGQTLAGKYRIEQRWREDADSATYHATQELIDKPVTLKVLDQNLAEFPDVVLQFQMEARVLSRIANPQILNVLDYGKDESGLPFLVLEAAEGRTLNEFIREEGGLSLERAARIARQIADALTIAHSNEVIHGNLSGDKILVSDGRDGEFVKILDFGAQNVAGDDEQTIVRANLPFYKSPEQLSGGEVDSRADIYSLGVILYELLTGNTPFTADNAVDLAQKHLREIPPSLIAARPDLPPVIEQVVQRALAKQPEQRFQTAQDFADALQNAVKTNAYAENPAYAAGFDGAARPTPQVEPQSAGNPYKTAFIVLAGIMVLSVVGIYITGGFRNTPTTQMNTDPNAQPVQPVQPVTSTAEDLSNVPLPGANINSNLDPMALPPPGVTGVPQGIPPGLYPQGGQVVTIPGNSNSIFMGDMNVNAGVQPNANTRPANANVRPTNTNAAVNANVAATPRPANTNAGNANAAPKPTPTAAPASTPKPTPAKPADTPKPGATNSGSTFAPGDV